MFFKPLNYGDIDSVLINTPSNCNTSVIPMLLYKFCPRKPNKPVHTTHTLTHSSPHTHTLTHSLSLTHTHPSLSLSHTHHSPQLFVSVMDAVRLQEVM